jgi:hypothetical protein
VCDVVLVSSWRRADYLKIVFDALLKARGIEEKQVWVFQNNRYDRGIDLEPVHRVLKYYSKLFPSFQVTNQTFWDRNVPGWWYSQKAALESVHKANADRMFFFSDDTVCTPDFFEWHDAVNKDQSWFGSTAWRPASGNTKPFDLEAYYVMSFPNEISQGLCLKHEQLGWMLECGTGWPSQDYMIEKQWKIVMPYVPRCYHIGGFSSHLESVGENTGPSVDKLPNPIPDYGPQKATLQL